MYFGMCVSPAFVGLLSSQHGKTAFKRLFSSGKHCSVAVSQNTINDKTFKTDSYTNVTPKIISRLGRKLFNQKHHPICLLKERVTHYFHSSFRNKRGNPLFSLYDDLSPVVTVQQNFDSLLVPRDHPSRAKADCFYINGEWVLRSHMTAHQSELIRMGLNNFLMVGDVYRNDAVDRSHFPVFHQLDGVRLLTAEELFAGREDGAGELEVRERKDLRRTMDKQEAYTVTAVKVVEGELKRALEGLTKDLFGEGVRFRWCEAFFPFTHPSWELFVLLNGEWIEVLGCGVVEHKILENSGCADRIGWAFGLGLERLAMIYYAIPDIRTFWSEDEGFLRQFRGKTWADRVAFKEVSAFPPCHLDLSFWVGEGWEERGFEEVAREHCGEELEHVELIDRYADPKSGRESRCYRVTYRSLHRTLTKREVGEVHRGLAEKLRERFKVEIR